MRLFNAIGLRSQWLVLPLLLILVINVAAFFLFSSVGNAVGAETGTDGYKEIAENLVSGNGFIYEQGMRSTAMLGYMKREPLYPLFLSVILRLTGTLNPTVLWLFQTPLSLIACCLLYRLGSRVFGESTGRLASFVYAVHPLSFWYSSRFASEVLSVPIMLACLILAEKFFSEPSYGRASLLGFSIAIATLTRSACVILLAVVLLFAVFKWHTKFRPVFLSYALIIVLCYMSVDSIWLLRNYSISGEIVPFTTMSGPTFYVGNEIVERFDVRRHTAGDAPDQVSRAVYRAAQDQLAATAPEMSLPRLEAKTDKALIKAARQFVIQKPMFLIRKFLWGMYFIWFLSDTAAKSIGWMLFEMPLVLLAIVGVYKNRRLDFIERFLLAVVVVYIVPHTVLAPLARYSMPVIPILMLFASSAIVSFFKSNSNRAYSF